MIVAKCPYDGNPFFRKRKKEKVIFFKTYSLLIIIKLLITQRITYRGKGNLIYTFVVRVLWCPVA